MKHETYHEKLKIKMDEYAHLIYGITKDFPKEELYRVTSGFGWALFQYY